MKWLAFILSLYFSFLSIVSCADTVSADHKQEVITTMSTSPGGHEHEHDGEGLTECSPLCSCHCCHVHISFLDFKTATFYRPSSIFKSFFRLHYKGQKNFDFFIPPKFA